MAKIIILPKALVFDKSGEIKKRKSAEELCKDHSFIWITSVEDPHKRFLTCKYCASVSKVVDIS